MSDHKQTVGDYRLTTAEIIYRMPDHPDLLQSFIWQKLDVAPDFPELRRFLEYCSRNIEGSSTPSGSAKPALSGARTSTIFARRFACINVILPGAVSCNK